MKKMIIVMVYVAVLLFPLKINAYMPNEYYGFIKKDEQGNFINDAEFKIHSLDGSIEYDVWKEQVQDFEDLPEMTQTPLPMSTMRLKTGTIANNGVYLFNRSGTEEYDKLLSILGPEERQILEDLKDPEKINSFYELQNGDYSSDYAFLQATRGISIYKNCGDYSPTPNKDVSLLASSCHNINISVPVLMILEETKAPEGLKKEKAILLFEYEVYYIFDSNDLTFDSVGGVYYHINDLMYKYNSSIDYSDFLDFFRNMMLIANEEELYFKDECGNYLIPVLDTKMNNKPMNSSQNYRIKKMNDDNCRQLPVIIDHENGAVLTISSYVNNGGSTKAVKGSEVNYKIVVKNEGTGDSTNNVITSKIPEGFEYVEGSASDNGVYLASSNSVRWNIDVIGVESTKELTYKVSVTEDVDLTKTYTSTATVMNDGSNEIVSNETVVTLEGDIVNPKTGDFNSIIVLFVLSVIGLIGYYLIDRRTIKGL